MRGRLVQLRKVEVADFRERANRGFLPAEDGKLTNERDVLALHACELAVHDRSRLDHEISQASEGSLSVAEAYTAPDGEAPMDRASLIHALKNCADLAWDAGPHYAEALARKTASFVKNVLQQGNLTQGNPCIDWKSFEGKVDAGTLKVFKWAGDPEVADPVRGSGSSVKRKKRPEPGRPAGKSGKKGRVARLEKVECKV